MEDTTEIKLYDDCANFEQSVMLKNLGFPQEEVECFAITDVTVICDGYKMENIEETIPSECEFNCYDEIPINGEYCSMPSLYKVVKWLCLVKDINILCPRVKKQSSDGSESWKYYYVYDGKDMTGELKLFDSPTDALYEGITEVLTKLSK